jgi:hypothetical protein
VVLLWHRVREPVIVMAITVFTGLLSTSQRWAGLDTPDSSFYASLSLFGDEVTDRAPETSYYWTRLGVIVPNRLLTTLFGTWPGFGLYRMLLLLLIVAATYVTLRRFTSIASAAFLATITSLSTVVLSYLGNPYLTGTVLAGTAVLIACAMFDSRWAAAIAGVTLGWLVMVNPPGVLLAGTIWLVLRLLARTGIVHLLIAAGTTVVTFGLFLGAGRIVFPRMDWLGTYLDSNARLVYSDFASKDAVWLRDISLIVPVAILVTVFAVWLTHRDSVAAQRAFAISASSIAFMLVFSPLMGGIPLEAPMYQAMLWPPAHRSGHSRHPRDARYRLDPTTGSGRRSRGRRRHRHCTRARARSRLGLAAGRVVAVCLFASTRAPSARSPGCAAAVRRAGAAELARRRRLYYSARTTGPTPRTPSPTASTPPSTPRSGCSRTPRAMTRSSPGCRATGWAAIASSTSSPACSCGARTASPSSRPSPLTTSRASSRSGLA